MCARFIRSTQAGPRKVNAEAQISSLAFNIVRHATLNRFIMHKHNVCTSRIHTYSTHRHTLTHWKGIHQTYGSTSAATRMCVAASHSGGPHRRALRVRAQRVPNAPLHRAMHIPHGEADIGCVDVPARLMWWWSSFWKTNKCTHIYIWYIRCEQTLYIILPKSQLALRRAI